MSAVLAALVVPALLLVRAARADVAVGVAPEPEPSFQVVLSQPGTSGAIELVADPSPTRAREAWFSLRVAVPDAPEGRFVLELRDANGGRLARCVEQRRVNRYTRLALLRCPLAEPERLGAVLVEASVPVGYSLVHVYRRRDGLYGGGSLLAAQPRGVAPALERLSVARPAAFGAPTMLLSAGLSSALLVAAGLAATGRPRDGRPASGG